jgi:hypothetical protein
MGEIHLPTLVRSEESIGFCPLPNQINAANASMKTNIKTITCNEINKRF